MKRFLISLFGISVSIFVALIIWYGVSFLQYKKNIDDVISDSKKIYQGTDNSLYQLSVIAEGENGILRWASQRAYWDISKRNRSKKNITRQLNSLLWHLCISLHYDQKEIFYLWCHYCIYTDGYGLNKAASKYLGKDLINLSLEEKASIVSMVRNPERYKPGSEASKRRVKNILQRYNNS